MTPTGLHLDLDERNFVDFVRPKLEQLNYGPTNIFDVGAATGRWTRYVYELLYKVDEKRHHLFEPVNASWNKLNKRYINDPKFTVNHTVVADNPGLTTFWTAHFLEHSSMFQGPEEGLIAEVKPVTSIDAYSAYLNIDRIAFMKVDVEGAELAVFAGADRMLSEQRIDFMQFEYGGTWATVSLTAQCAKFNAMGYRVIAYDNGEVHEFAPNEDLQFRNLLVARAALL